VWDEAFDAQLVGDSITGICSECHTAELGGATATAGETIHNTTTEILAGKGAIGVPNMPGVHKGKCVTCHMPPTSYSRGSVQLGGNHTFKIIDPEVAAEVSPIPVSTTTPNPTASPVVNTAPMPYSACSTCHGKPSDPLATYLQSTIEERQTSMEDKIVDIKAELGAASLRIGAPIGVDDDETIDWTLNGHDTWVGLNNQADVTGSELSYQKAYTNMTIIENEGSMGVHNWQYSSAVADKALDQAAAVKASLTGITVAPNVTSGVYGTPVMFTGTVTGGVQEDLAGGQVRLWQQNAGSATWNVVASTYLTGDGSDEFEFWVMPSKSAIYHAQFVGNDTYEAITSADTASVNIAWYCSLSASPTTLKKNKSVTFKGMVEPTNAFGLGALVNIQKKNSSGVYVAWKTALLNADGTWSLKVKMTKTGKTTYRAEMAATTTLTEGWSASKTITVKAP
jgi:hypothetical protein